MTTKTNLNIGLLLLRITIAGPMLIYGISKLIHGISFIQGLLQTKGLPAFIGYGVYVGEVIAPILMLIGLRTRIASLIFAMNCFTALLLAQLPMLFTLNENGGWSIELLFIYLTGALSLYFTGGGKLAVSRENHWD